MKEFLHLPRDGIRKVRRAARRQYFFPVLPSSRRQPEAATSIFSRFRMSSVTGRSDKALSVDCFPISPRPLPLRPPKCVKLIHWPSLNQVTLRLAGMLGHAEQNSTIIRRLNFFETIGKRPLRYPGTIGPSDYLFLTAFVSILAPQRVVEIGTLTGFSAAIIAATLRRQSGEESAKRVDTIDVLEKCFIDDTRPTGFEIAESFPELASIIRLHVPHDSMVVSKLAEPDELEIVFIDANHQHPLPLLDLLRLAPYVRRGGWIVLHDIQLGTMGRKASDADSDIVLGSGGGSRVAF